MDIRHRPLTARAGLGVGALARYVTDPNERLELVERVATDCELAGQLDWAMELFMYAGAGGPALRLVCQDLSSRLEEAASDPRKGVLLSSVSVKADVSNSTAERQKLQLLLWPHGGGGMWTSVVRAWHKCTSLCSFVLQDLSIKQQAISKRCPNPSSVHGLCCVQGFITGACKAFELCGTKCRP